jgi:phytoene dehydrogenase-like protein
MLIQHFFQQTPTFFALSYFGQYFDYSYPLGGTGVLTKKLTQYIASNGGTVMTGTGVADVDARRKEIRTEKGECFGYKKLVWAADLKLLYNSLRPEPGGNAAKHQALVNESRAAIRCWPFSWGRHGKDCFEIPLAPMPFSRPPPRAWPPCRTGRLPRRGARGR